MYRTSSVRRGVRATITTLSALGLLGAALLAVPGAAGAAQQPGTGPAGGFLFRDGRFTPLGAVPGAEVAGHVNINNRGQVVGFYSTADGTLRSFITDVRDGVRTFAVPGAAATLAAGINDRGQVAGTYFDRPLSDEPTSGNTPHGFIRQPDGHITRVDLPAAFDGAAVTDINNRGQVVGETVTDGRGIGFLRDTGGKVTTIRLPGRAGVGDILSVNDHDQVVGYWDETPGAPVNAPHSKHGFIWNAGRVSRFDVPRSLSTGALGINNAGHIAGSYDDPAGRHHGFLLKRGHYTRIDAPGRTLTDAWGINDRDQIVIPDLGTGLIPVTR